MKTHRIGKGKHGLTGGFSSLAITQPAHKKPETGAPEPSLINVTDAKNWVDYNKK